MSYKGEPEHSDAQEMTLELAFQRGTTILSNNRSMAVQLASGLHGFRLEDFGKVVIVKSTQEVPWIVLSKS